MFLENTTIRYKNETGIYLSKSVNVHHIIKRLDYRNFNPYHQVTDGTKDI